MSIAIEQSILEDRIDKAARVLGVSKDHAFLHLVFGLVTGLGFDELEPESLVDGGGDKQLDVIHIDDSADEDRVTVTVIQGKTSKSFQSNAMTQFGAGLEWLLIHKRDRCRQLENLRLRDQIERFRDLRTEVGPANIDVRCYFATLGDASKLSREFREGVESVRQRFAGSTEFSLEVFGASELVALIDESEARESRVTERLGVDYDLNRNTLLEHTVPGVQGLICTAKASEIARIVNRHPTVFDRNIRRFLGTRGAVNAAIKSTCSSAEDGQLFWFLNNGITIICDSYEINRDPDSPWVKIENLQIVNGCQTSATIAACEQEGTLSPTARVMLKIFKASGDLADKVVITTNNQNRITSRDLKANDPRQANLQRAFKEQFGLNYERKPNEYASLDRQSQRKVVSSERVGQAYLAVVLKRPSDARRRKYKVWGEDYDRIFGGVAPPESYLLAYRIVEICTALKRSRYGEYVEIGYRRKALANGVLHVARAVSFLWRGGDEWSDPMRVSRDLRRLEESPEILEPFFDQGLGVLFAAIEDDKQFVEDVSSALKSAKLDEAITRSLYESLT